MSDVRRYRSIAWTVVISMVLSGVPVTRARADNPPNRFVYFHLDQIGTPRLVLDETGAIVAQHHYLPYGEERPVPATADATLSRRAFTGQERDRESGLDYMLARYYSSSLGRFVAVDPSRRSVDPEDPQSWNRYTYALNNPLLLVDPDGEAARIYIVNATSQTSGSFNANHVANAVQQKFDKAGGAASVKVGKPSLGARLKAAFSKDTLHVVKLVDAGSAKEGADTKKDYGHGAGKDPETGKHLPAETHVGNQPTDNPSTPGNEREGAIANNVTHEVGHELGLSDNQNSPSDVMTGPDPTPASEQDFNAKDAAEVKKKTHAE